MKGSIELTQEEAKALIQILNVTVQAKGLSVAETCVYFQKKISKAMSQEAKVEAAPVAAEVVENSN